jgi:hypothetical protein
MWAHKETRKKHGATGNQLPHGKNSSPTFKIDKTTYNSGLLAIHSAPAKKPIKQGQLRVILDRPGAPTSGPVYR